MVDKITVDDVMEFENLFSMAPAFLLERMAKKKKNLVKKFKSKVQFHLDSASDEQLKKVDIVLNSDIDDVQAIMREAYEKTNDKHYKILANPKYKEFIEINLNELKNMRA